MKTHSGWNQRRQSGEKPFTFVADYHVQSPDPHLVQGIERVGNERAPTDREERLRK
jgi:hypothetical protein